MENIINVGSLARDYRKQYSGIVKEKKESSEKVYEHPWAIMKIRGKTELGIDSFLKRLKPQKIMFNMQICSIDNGGYAVLIWRRFTSFIENDTLNSKRFDRIIYFADTFEDAEDIASTLEKQNYIKNFKGGFIHYTTDDEKPFGKVVVSE